MRAPDLVSLSARVCATVFTPIRLDALTPWLIIVGGVTGILGEWRGRPLVLSLRAGWPEMVMPTAVLFIVLGVTLLTYRTRHGFRMLMGTVLLSASVTASMILTMVPLEERPSLGTLLGFMLSALVVLLPDVTTRRTLSTVVWMIAALAIVGLLTDHRALDWHWPQVSNGMAFPTALLLLSAAR